MQSSLEYCQFQYKNVKIYRDFCDLLKTNPRKVESLEDIPFLPIEIFKTHKVIAKNLPAETVFVSSGTTGQITSRHYVAHTDLYEQSFIKAFTSVYGPVSDYAILALLPSYLERKGSSLIYMVNDLIEQTENIHSGFYLNEMEELTQKIHYLEEKKQKTILIGVSYALLDLIEQNQFHLKNTIVMETGGMKGRRREMIK